MHKAAKIIKIGNSRGIRLPKNIIIKYKLGEEVLLEERPNGILIRSADEKLSWEDTYKEMIKEEKDEWSEWNNLDIDADDYL